jgi:hypothetical protein
MVEVKRHNFLRLRCIGCNVGHGGAIGRVRIAIRYSNEYRREEWEWDSVLTRIENETRQSSAASDGCPALTVTPRLHVQNRCVPTCTRRLSIDIPARANLTSASLWFSLTNPLLYSHCHTSWSIYIYCFCWTTIKFAKERKHKASAMLLLYT